MLSLYMIKRSSYSQETFFLSNVGYDTLKYEYHYLLLLAMDKEKKTREGKKTKGGISKMMSKDSKLFTVIGQKLDQFHENI